MAYAPLDPSLALQAAVHEALTTHPATIAAFQALAANAADVPRVYDTAPVDQNQKVPTALFPYFTIGEDQIVPDTPGITDECFVDVKAWSRPTQPVSYAELKTLLNAARIALDQPLQIAGFNTITWRLHGSPPPRKEPDGVTRRGVLTFVYLVSPAALQA
ncbi:MAG TPA: DUF3168 domain-containing protein [Caulobacteraceae bacterium]|jgi:hypothetical protein